MRLPFEIGHGPVIPNVMQARGSDEFVFPVNAQRRLDVEGMPTRQPNQGAVAGDPFVRRPDVAMIGIIGQIPHGCGSLDLLSGWSLAILVDGRNGYRRGVWAVQFVAGGCGVAFGEGVEVVDGGGGFD